MVAKLAGRAFGEAGRTVVIEEGLVGPEVSLLCVADGRIAVPLASAQDFKRVGDGDTGPNTGGMGAYSPVPERRRRRGRAAGRRPSCSPPSTSCAGAASTTAACCTPG